VAIIQKAVATATAGKNGGLIKNNSLFAQGEIWTIFSRVCSSVSPNNHELALE
jgi:hypothetical protein